MRITDATKPRLEGGKQGLLAIPAGPGELQYDWEPPRTIESCLGVSLDGLPIKLALRSLGNAVVPQVIEIFGRAIIRVNEAIKEKSSGK